MYVIALNNRKLTEFFFGFMNVLSYFIGGFRILHGVTKFETWRANGIGLPLLVRGPKILRSWNFWDTPKSKMAAKKLFTCTLIRS